MEEKKEKNGISFKSIFGLDKGSRLDKGENIDNKETSRKNEGNIKEQKVSQSLIKTIGPSNFVIILMVGILLLLLSWPNATNKSKNSKKTTESTPVNNANEEVTISKNRSKTEIYVHSLEERLEEVLRKVDGVGQVEVMITLKGSKELIVLKDEPYRTERVDENDAEGGKRTTSNHDQDENTILVENEDGSKTPYILKELEPEVEGIVVIATGGNNAEIKSQIIEAVQVLFGVPAHKVKVMKMN